MQEIGVKFGDPYTCITRLLAIIKLHSAEFGVVFMCYGQYTELLGSTYSLICIDHWTIGVDKNIDILVTFVS
jgi:hypothetical protein